jgi:heme/copper-type cytochrome/quinol oxidase subunit 2
MVLIKLVNADTQTHGFAIDLYAIRGTEIQGGQSLTVQFLASKAGQFRIYCNVPCSVHWSMLYGSLNVS